MAHEEIKALFGEMFANAIVGHLSPDRKQREDSNRIVFFFDAAVDALRSPLFPNVPVNEAVTLMWRLIGNRMIPSAAGPVPTLSFTALGNDPKHLNAAVLIPANWPDLIAQNYKYQLGGIVFVASQCRDWYNGKLIVKPEDLRHPDVVRRAECYEASYLRTVLEQDPNYQLNGYQKHVLEVAPNGLLSLGNLAYESKPFAVGLPSPLLARAFINTVPGGSND